MRNMNLAKVMALSLLTIPAIVNAGIVSHTKMEIGGALSVQGKNEITLKEHAGQSITLKKGHANIEISKKADLFSFNDPTLIIKQGGQTFTIEIPKSSYHNKDAFTLKSEDSNLNYDVYLRKNMVKGKTFEREEMEGCTYQKTQMECTSDSNGSLDCGNVTSMAFGDQKGIATYQVSAVNYKLTLAQKDKGLAEFNSNLEEIKKIKFSATEMCD